MSLSLYTTDVMKWLRSMCKCDSDSETTELAYCLLDKACRDQPNFINYILNYYNTIFKPNRKDGRKNNKGGGKKNGNP